jgi:hypothetical protein
MGQSAVGSLRADLAGVLGVGTLGALNAVTAAVAVQGFVNLSIRVPAAFSGTVSAERSFDNGTTWLPVRADGYGTPVAFAAADSSVEYEPEAGMLWRLRASAYTSGSCEGRISQ